MPCDPGDNNLNPPVLPPPPLVPGFGIPFSPIQIPYPDVAIPEGIPEDVLALVNSIFAWLPGGFNLKAVTSETLQNTLDAVASVLGSIQPWLSLYTFFQPVLDIILCILDIICAWPNPFKVIRATKRLFKECIPAFLSLFPWFALVALIYSLLLLLIELLLFMIQKLTEFIEQLIANLLVLAQAAALKSEEAVLAATLKIAYLFCIFEQLFAVLVMFQVIFGSIKSVLGLSGKFVCFGSSSDCCDECPTFPEEGITGTLGALFYLNEVEQNPPAFPPLRNESWQFGDASSPPQAPDEQIISIVTPINFWPEGITFTADSTPAKVPYTVDMKLTLDPHVFHPLSPAGLKTFNITNCIVSQQPVPGVEGATPTSTISSGVVKLVGGLVTNADGTPFMVPVGAPAADQQQATLETFIHLSPSIFPGGKEEVIQDISYTLKINYEALLFYQLITVGCVPEIAYEAELLSLRLPNLVSLEEKIGGPLPDMDAGLLCLQTSLNNLRKDVSFAKVGEFQLETIACIDVMRADACRGLVSALESSIDVFHSTIEVDPETQFINLPIKATVQLYDANNTPLAFQIPEDCPVDLDLQGQVTLGEISDFVFDPGTGTFNADINSANEGDGYLSVTFNGEAFSDVEGLDVDDPTSIVTRLVPYTFIGIGGLTGTSGQDPLPRRDVTDTSALEGGD